MDVKLTHLPCGWEPQPPSTYHNHYTILEILPTPLLKSVSCHCADILDNSCLFVFVTKLPMKAFQDCIKHVVLIKLLVGKINFKKHTRQ